MHILYTTAQQKQEKRRKAGAFTRQVNKASSIAQPSYSRNQINRINSLRPLINQTRFQSSSSKMPSTLKTGDTIPSGRFKYVPYGPRLPLPHFHRNSFTLKTESWKGKKIVLFGVPGAFTQTCSNNHLPGFIEKAADMKSKGVSGVYCVASNDEFVMSGWGCTLGSNEHVVMISDANFEWLEAAGLTVDLSGFGLGKRACRFALIIDDLKVTYVGIENSPDSVASSAAEAVLAEL